MAVNAVGQAANADGIITFHDDIKIKLLCALNRAEDKIHTNLVLQVISNNFYIHTTILPADRGGEEK
jgi:hypothetical protein